MISSKIISKLFNLAIEKQPKRKILYCSVCKCRTLKEQASLNGYTFWQCARPDHDEKIGAYFEKLAINNLDIQYVDELKKIEKEV